MKRLFIAIATILAVHTVQAQVSVHSFEQEITTDTTLEKEPVIYILNELSESHVDGGKVDLIVPAEVGVMMKSHIAQNQKNQQYSGFRIQIASVNSAQKDIKELEKQRDMFEEKFPDIQAYLLYTVPDFKIRVGNYRNKLEAIPDLNEIRKVYPDSYAVKCNITGKELKRETFNQRKNREAAEAAQLLLDSLNAIETRTLPYELTD